MGIGLSMGGGGILPLHPSFRFALLSFSLLPLLLHLPNICLEPQDFLLLLLPFLSSLQPTGIQGKAASGWALLAPPGLAHRSHWCPVRGSGTMTVLDPTAGCCARPGKSLDWPRDAGVYLLWVLTCLLPRMFCYLIPFLPYKGKEDSVLGPVLFNVFINDPVAAIECVLSTLVGNAESGGAAHSLEDRGKQGQAVAQRAAARHSPTLGPWGLGLGSAVCSRGLGSGSLPARGVL